MRRSLGSLQQALSLGLARASDAALALEAVGLAPEAGVAAQTFDSNARPPPCMRV